MYSSKISNLYFLLLLICLSWNTQASASNASTTRKQNIIEGESFVLANTSPSNFLYTAIVKGSVTVRSTYLSTDSGSIIYAEGADYIIDYKKGTIARTVGSRIPDYANHPLFEKLDFNQYNFSNYNNTPYFIWVDYATKKSDILNDDKTSTVFLSKFTSKLENGSQFTIVSSGNSIAAGAEASSIQLRYQNRWVDYLKALYPKANINLQEASMPGYTSREAITNWEAYVGKKNPDLVLLGWGMNEGNVGGMSPAEYQNNLIKLVQLAKGQNNAEVIIYSCFRPNDNWHYAGHSMNLYTEAAKKAAEIANCAYVNVYDIFEKVFARKDQASLLSNNINHPNNFGHWLYFQAFKNLQF